MPSENEITKQQVRLVSHEIRNQLSISDIYCEIIRKQLIKNGIENECIEHALDCIQKSAKLIGNSLLDLKLMTNIELKPISVNQLAEESIELGKSYIYDKQIDIVSDLSNDVIIQADRNKLLACLINLIKNAAEAIETRGTIKIKTSTDKEFAKISVSNNGKPIPKNVRSKLFTDGFTTKANGSGIGLYLSKENLKAIGGDLILRNSQNTEFEILLKLT